MVQRLGFLSLHEDQGRLREIPCAQGQQSLYFPVGGRVPLALLPSTSMHSMLCLVLLLSATARLFVATIEPPHMATDLDISPDTHGLRRIAAGGGGRIPRQSKSLLLWCTNGRLGVLTTRYGLAA